MSMRRSRIIPRVKRRLALGVVTAIIRLPFKPEVAGSSPAWRISPMAQLVELRNTTQQHRKSKQLLCPSWSKEMDLSSIGVLLRAGSNPAGSILWMDHSNYYIFSWFSPMTGGFDPRGGADHCLGGRKKKQNPSSKFYKSTTQQFISQPNF